VGMANKGNLEYLQRHGPFPEGTTVVDLSRLSPRFSECACPPSSLYEETQRLRDGSYTEMASRGLYFFRNGARE